jgi:hypothetical protein
LFDDIPNINFFITWTFQLIFQKIYIKIIILRKPLTTITDNVIIWLMLITMDSDWSSPKCLKEGRKLVIFTKWLMLSVFLYSKKILSSGFHCIFTINFDFDNKLVLRTKIVKMSMLVTNSSLFVHQIILNTAQKCSLTNSKLFCLTAG